jgi:hypothetical protein
MTAAKKTNKKASAQKSAAKKPASAKPPAKTPVPKAAAKSSAPSSSGVKSKPALSLLKFPRPSLVSQLSGSSERINPRLQATIDRSEISELLTSFARGLDRIDENLLRSVLHHDATLDFGPGVFQGTGSDYVHWVMGVLHGLRSSHHMITNTRR